MGWNSWDSNWRDFGSDRPDYSNIIFVSSHEDMKKEIELQDIGKELVLMEQHAYCETCDKTLRAFVTQTNAQKYVDKHLGYKKYAGHKAFVKKVDLSAIRKCTTADIIGTKANIERNQSLRDALHGQVRSKITRIINDNDELITKVMETFGFTERKDEIPETPSNVENGYVYLFNNIARAHFKATDFESIKQLFNGTWGKDREDLRHQDLHDRAGMIMHILNVTGHYKYDEHVYSWDYPIKYDHFIGHDTEPAGDCHFCGEKIESWNDLFDGGHISNEYVHRKCFKHFEEKQSLDRYAQRYAEEQAKKEQEVIAS